MHYISLLTTLVAFAFAGAVLYRYAHRKGIHLLLWGVGMVFYGLGSLGEVILGLTFSPLALRIWYVSGAMMTAAWLGQGTIHLLVRRRGVAPAITLGLLAVSLLALGLVFTAPIASGPGVFDVTQPISTQYREVMTRSGLLMFLTVVLNIYGTIALAGGALYSAYLFWRKHILVQRMYGNILIAAGAMMPAIAGSLVKLGLADWLYFSELMGAIVMFTGFLLATANKPVSRQVRSVSTPSH